MRNSLWKFALAAIVLLNAAPSIASSCGTWDRKDNATAFAARPTGTLALVDSSGYYTLARGTCVNYRNFGDLYFQINHNNASVTQPTFVSVHVALVKFKSGANAFATADQQYLYRNTGAWNKDRSGLRYKSAHQTPHATFNQQLLGDQATFNQQYHDDANRTWHDSVDTDTSQRLRFETWNYGKTFSVRQELANAIQRGDVSVFTQNYLLSFTSRAKTDQAPDLGSPPDFTVAGRGYDCGIIRIAGTSILPEFDGEYMINRRGNTACDPLLSGFDRIDLISALFGPRANP